MFVVDDDYDDDFNVDDLILVLNSYHHSMRWVLKKDFEKQFFYENAFENQLHKQGPTRHANLFTGLFGKLRVSSDYYKRDRTRNLTTCCAKVLIENGLKKATKCTQVT
jgi:hypothetical protein